MGFFDSLFGGGKKEEAPKAKLKRAKAPDPEATPAGGLTPDVIVAISASVGIVMEGVSAEIVAVVTATIVHTCGGVSAVRFKRASNAWAASGRQKIMDGRGTLLVFK